jgi:hypothetical protein
MSCVGAFVKFATFYVTRIPVNRCTEYGDRYCNWNRNLIHRWGKCISYCENSVLSWSGKTDVCLGQTGRQKNRLTDWLTFRYFMFCWPCVSKYVCNETNLMHYLSSVYCVTIPVHVSGLLVAHHQEVVMYICDNWYVLYVLVDCRWAWWE